MRGELSFVEKRQAKSGKVEYPVTQPLTPLLRIALVPNTLQHCIIKVKISLLTLSQLGLSVSEV